MYAPELVQGSDGEELADVVELCTGAAHGCARRSDETIVCWGSDGYGQLGSDDEPSGRSRAVPVSLRGVVSLACGHDHTCAVLDDGKAYCWGLNGQAQLGTGTTMNASTPVQVSLPGLDAAASIHAGAGALSTCIQLRNGEVYCWGWNYYRQLGLGSAAPGNPVIAPALVTSWPQTTVR